MSAIRNCINQPKVDLHYKQPGTSLQILWIAWKAFQAFDVHVTHVEHAEVQPEKLPFVWPPAAKTSDGSGVEAAREIMSKFDRPSSQLLFNYHTNTTRCIDINGSKPCSMKM